MRCWKGWDTRLWSQTMIFIKNKRNNSYWCKLLVKERKLSQKLSIFSPKKSRIKLKKSWDFTINSHKLSKERKKNSFEVAKQRKWEIEDDQRLVSEREQMELIINICLKNTFVSPGTQTQVRRQTSYPNATTTARYKMEI